MTISTPSMTLGPSTTTQVQPGADALFCRILTEPLQTDFCFGSYGDVRVIPLNHNNTIRFRRFNNIPVDPTLPQLQDGVTPNGISLSHDDSTATLAQYGNYIRPSDNVKKLIEDPITVVCAKRLSYHMAQVMDTLARNALITGSHVTACTAGQSPNQHGLNAADLQLVVTKLLGRMAKPIREMILPEAKDGTTGIRPSFIAIAHTDLIPQLESVTNFRSIERYSQADKILPMEWGATGNIRWIMTPNGHKDTSGTPTIYKVPVLAQTAYARVQLGEGANANPLIVKELGSAGTADPLDQRASVGYKFWWAFKVLNDDALEVVVVQGTG